MSQESEQYKKFSRRAFVLGGLKLGVFGALTARLGYLQISEQKKFKTLSDKNRIGHRLLTAARGDIVDRFGVPLAVNNQNFRAFIIPEQIADLNGFFINLRNYIPLSDFEEKEIRIDLSKQRSFSPVLVKEGLTWEQTAQLEFNLPDLPGLFIEEGDVRNYPLALSTAHIIGYVGRVNESEMTDDPLMRMPGFRIGKSGIEKEYDLKLRGQSGTVQTEVNAVGREIRQLNENKGRKGERVSLTIDAELQIFCQEILAQEKSASCVVMDAYTGAIYALASSPSFDPNLFTYGISADKYEELLSLPGAPFTNKTIAGAYPPGSTFKMVTALAGLEAGIITPSSSIYCKGYMEVGRDRFHCWKRSGHGHVELVKSLQQSCDIFYYELAEKLGIDKIAIMARKLGLGQKLGIDLPNERTGLVPDKDWKRGHFGTKWQIGETVVAAIGQGYLQTTPLQLATMTARIANGGHAVTPFLSMDKAPLQKAPSLGLSQKDLKIVMSGMAAVTTSERGTAYSARIMNPKMAMAGKTGTAQVRRITRAQRLEGWTGEGIPWKYRDHALFVAYAPIQNPRYVCSIVVEHGGSGSGTAAPLARDIMEYTQKRGPANKSEAQDNVSE